MKPISAVIFLLTLSSTGLYGQTAVDHLQMGIVKQNKQDYKSAIEEYEKAIRLDKDYANAYYNRGSCEMALKDYKSAMYDFSKTIDLDPTFTKAYYSRATVYASNQKYMDALPDLDKLIELKPTFPNALTLRGQIRAQTGNVKGGCEDFHLANENGDLKAKRYIEEFCNQAQESLVLDLPAEENWIVGDDQDNGATRVQDYIHKNEKIDVWTELVNTTTMKGVKGIPVDKAMDLMYDQAKKLSPKSKMLFIEKDEKAEHPWILFELQSPGTKKDKTPESQLWYIVQGKQALYTNFIAVKQVSLPQALKDKWVPIFKRTKLESK